MSSEARPCRGFANVAALWWRVCEPTISPRKKDQPPAGELPRRTAGLWRIGAGISAPGPCGAA